MSRRALLFVGGVVTAGCAPAHPPTPAIPPPARSTACRLTTDSVSPARSASAVFEDSADARRAELAAPLEPPIRFDCEGRPIPGAATAWSHDSTGRFWTLELSSPPPEAALRWTAGALAATWRADLEAAATLHSAGVVSLVPLDDRRLVVGFSTPHLDLPPVFAALALGVARDAAGPIVAPTPAGIDLRDAIDRGPDLIVMTDPDLLDYARQRPGVTIQPLPWSRTYLLVLPRDARLDIAMPDTAAFRSALAHDAVRQDARPAEAAAWWEGGRTCPARDTLAAARRRDNIVAYPRADPVARALAERLVAIAPSGQVTARGLAADSLATSLRQGAARAFVIGVAAHELLPCRHLASWPDSARVIPLIETRSHAVVRRGAPALVSDWDGTVRVERP